MGGPILFVFLFLAVFSKHSFSQSTSVSSALYNFIHHHNMVAYDSYEQKKTNKYK